MHAELSVVVCIHVGMDFLRLAELRNTVSLTERGLNAAIECGYTCALEHVGVAKLIQADMTYIYGSADKVAF
jgi:hypothetical protein